MYVSSIEISMSVFPSLHFTQSAHEIFTHNSHRCKENSHRYQRNLSAYLFVILTAPPRIYPTNEMHFLFGIFSCTRFSPRPFPLSNLKKGRNKKETRKKITYRRTTETGWVTPCLHASRPCRP